MTFRCVFECFYCQTVAPDLTLLLTPADIMRARKQEHIFKHT